MLWTTPAASVSKNVTRTEVATLGAAVAAVALARESLRVNFAWCGTLQDWVVLTSATLSSFVSIFIPRR
jgi:hypothetical protein